MKKLTFITVLLLILTSCKKDEVEKATAPTTEEVCGCGIISDIDYFNDGSGWETYTVIYNECTMNDTTVNYLPQTSAGNDKGIDDPHCLGVNW